MSASGQRPCSPSHGRGHHLPGRSTSIAALWRTAWLQESACWAVAVERWARRAPTRRRKGLFHPFVRYLSHLDVEPAFYVPSFGAAMLSGAPSADDACCSATPLHGSGLSSGAPVAAATSAGVMRAHFGARYTWPRRCCAGCCTAVADHLLLETKGCAAVGRGFVMSSDSTEAWDTEEWAVIELQHHPCRPFGPHPLL